MRYVILHILCEGQTEEKFVKIVLSPYLLTKRPVYIFPKPVLLVTNKKKGVQGGMISYAQAKIGIESIIKHCQHFSEWIAKICSYALTTRL